MAFWEEAHFIHQVTDAITVRAQQKRRKTTGTVEEKNGIVGKTFPIQRVAAVELPEVTVRNGTTQFLDPFKDKRRVALRDFMGWVPIDDFDQAKELVNANSVHVQQLVYARERRMDRLLVSIPGRTPAGAAGTEIGGILGGVTTVDEANESTGTAFLPAAQQILHDTKGLTLDKWAEAKLRIDLTDHDEDDLYCFISPRGVKQLLTNAQVTSADFATQQALTRMDKGGFGVDEFFYGFKVRTSNLLPSAVSDAGNGHIIRSAMFFAKSAVNYGHGAVPVGDGVQIVRNPERNNNLQAGVKMSGAAGRNDDVLVVQLDYDENI
jgi:capsid protein